MQRISVIDLGSNSVKLVNFNISPDNSYQAYQQETATVRLAEGLSETGNLKEAPTSRTINALKLFRDIINVQRVRHVVPVATSAVREAANRDEFLDRVYLETGFRFKVLSEEEEALYSYAGAIHSLRLPSVLFFDIGGGSLELVSSSQFKIKKIVSLPLGTLRLKQMFSDEDGIVSQKNFEKMNSYILELLPSRKELQLGDDAVLVGVGGTLRAMAKYHQHITGYPLDKIHNYKISAKAIHSICNRFLNTRPEKIAKISTISNNRAETIAVGSCLIDILMKRLSFEEITASAQGLREGTLLLSLEHPREFALGKIDQEHIQNSLLHSYEPDIIPQRLEDVVRFAISAGLLNEKESRILAHSLRHVPPSSTFQNIMNFLSSGMDVDSQLDHHNQLVSTLSIIYSKKKKAADKIFDRYSSVLQQSDKKSIRKISSLILLSELLSKSDVKIHAKMADSNLVRMRVHPVEDAFPNILFADILEKVADAFGVEITCSIHNPRHSTPQIIEI
jgi:exopolyphosphatase/guanosine-5'-triphosphate,3'-diphosphate pyrophosphatase